MNPGEVKRFRKPLLDTVKASPFEAIFRHSAKVAECVGALRPLVKVYLEKDYARAGKYVQRISKLEREADIIKRTLRENLPSSFFMPAPRSDILLLVKSQDRIADLAEDVARLMDMRPTEIPEPLAAGFRRHVAVCIETVRKYSEAVMELDNVLSTVFRSGDVEKLMNLVTEVHVLEHRADEVEKKLTKKLFQMEDDIHPVALIHLLKIFDRVDGIANSAETSANRLVTLVVK